jgi:protein-tyrosine phosphatase
MGTVHGVYLKYVGLSALSYAGYALLARDEYGARVSAMQLVARLLSKGASRGPSLMMHTVPALMLGYSAVLNGVIAVLFKLEKGMTLIGKDRKTGQIPLWSKIIFFPFHIPTRLYTYIHTRMHQEKVPQASEVLPGWWVGGCYGHELDKDWVGVIDLTVEFPESTIGRTKHYLSIPTWDGVPASPEQLEEGANFAVSASQLGGDILVHCAHGRGRSTTMMCACLVKAGLYENWQEAFEKGIKPGRPVCKLNRRMRQALTEWQARYVDGGYKKGL